MRQIEISTEFIKLDSLLKFCGAAPTGGAANTGGGGGGMYYGLTNVGKGGSGIAVIRNHR